MPVLAGLALVGVSTQLPANQEQGALAGGAARVAEKVVDQVQQAKHEQNQDSEFRRAVRKALDVLKDNGPGPNNNAAPAKNTGTNAQPAQGNANKPGNQADGQRQQNPNGNGNRAGAVGKNAQRKGGGGQQGGGNAGQEANGQPLAPGPEQLDKRRNTPKQPLQVLARDVRKDLAKADLPGGRAGTGRKKARLDEGVVRATGKDVPTPAQLEAKADSRQQSKNLFRDLQTMLKELKHIRQIKAENAQDKREIKQALKEFRQDKHDLRQDRAAVAANFAKAQGNKTTVAGNHRQKQPGNRQIGFTTGQGRARQQNQVAFHQTSHGAGGSGAVAGGMHSMHQAMVQHMAMAHQQAMVQRAMMAHMAGQRQGTGRPAGQAQGRHR
jgi:hypothetical protein